MANTQDISRDPTDLAYMAGIIDGEGSICIFPCYGRHHKYGGYRRYKAALCITNTSLKLMEWIATRYGQTIQPVKRARDNIPRWKPCYHLMWSGTKAAQIIVAIRPYLVIKTEQADLFLTFQGTMRRRGKAGTPLDIQKFRITIAQRMSHLNRRGPNAMVTI